MQILPIVAREDWCGHRHHQLPAIPASETSTPTCRLRMLHVGSASQISQLEGLVSNQITLPWDTTGSNKDCGGRDGSVSNIKIVCIAENQGNMEH